MRKAFLIPYGFLTLIKLFTAKVGLLADPTEKLVIKLYPTIGNTFQMLGEENTANIEKYKGTWYFEGKYMTLLADEHGFMGEGIYSFIILTWWLMSLLLVVYLVYRLVKNHNYKRA